MRLRAAHILVSKEFEAKDIERKLKEGKSFEELAKDFSICPSGKSGGDLGEFGKGMMIEKFEAALLKLKEGEISGIVPTQFGYHLILRK